MNLHGCIYDWCGMQRRRLDGYVGFAKMVFGGYLLSFLDLSYCVPSSVLAIPFLGGTLLRRQFSFLYIAIEIP